MNILTPPVLNEVIYCSSWYNLCHTTLSLVAWAPLLSSPGGEVVIAARHFLWRGLPHLFQLITPARAFAVLGRGCGKESPVKMPIGAGPQTMPSTKCDWLSHSHGPNSSLDPRRMQMWPKYGLVTFPYHTSFWHLNKQSGGRNLHLCCALSRYDKQKRPQSLQPPCLLRPHSL